MPRALWEAMTRIGILSVHLQQMRTVCQSSAITYSERCTTCKKHVNVTFLVFSPGCACSQILTVSLGKVRVRVQMGSAHVVAVPLRTDPSLLRPLVAVARRQRCGGRGAVRANRRVLVHNAA